MIYFKYIRMVLKSFAQYRSSMWLAIIGQFFGTCFAFAGIYLLFDRFDNIGGWTFAEASLCFGVVNTAFSLAELFARGFDQFQGYIRQGTFDRVMLRPRSTVLQVLGSNFEITRTGRLVQSFAVLGLSISWLDVAWSVPKIMTLILMIVSGTFIFTGLFILGATVCFFTVEGLEFINIFTDGGRDLAKYPLTVYSKWFMRFFTFAIPFGCFNYLPLMYLTDRVQGREILYLLSPIPGILFILPCLLVWRMGVRRYLSTGN